MQKRTIPALLAGVALSVAIPIAAAAEMSKDEMIASAMGAAPPSVSENATIVGFDVNMRAVVLKQGANGVTCRADDPATPSIDPQCFHTRDAFVTGGDSSYHQFLMGPLPRN